MQKKWITIIGSSLLVAGLAFSGAVFAKSDDSEVHDGTIVLDEHVEADFPALAKLTFDQAAQNALDAVQGQILKTELEDENGFLVYGVEVVTADRAIVEVKVDAGSGKVLAIERDKAEEDEHDSVDFQEDPNREE